MMNKLTAFCLAFLLFMAPASAAERVDLTAPDQVRAGTLTYSLTQLILDWEHGRIVVVLVGDNGERKEIVFGDADNARAMMRALNKANLSIMSLQRRILERLVTDGHLAGAISGIPD